MATSADVDPSVASVCATFDESALERWMTIHVERFAGPLTVQQFAGGQSNPTYCLATPDARYVLRRKPTGPLLKGAHDVLREARVMTALAPTTVPVAPVLAVCSDESVIGTHFYIMAFVHGRIFWDAGFGEIPRGERGAYFGAMNATIATLHNLDPGALDLTEFGRPGNFFERQIRRWTKQYLEDVEAGRDRDMDWLVEWLPTAIPQSEEARIVHGDFRCDNLIFHPDRPEIIAVLDWELSTLGSPLSDFAYHALMYRMPPDIVAGLGGADPRPLGLPTEQEYVADYCRRTGRSSIPQWDFYIAFNLFRMAAIFHGIKGRVARGTAASAQAKERAMAFPRLVRLALEAAESCR